MGRARGLARAPGPHPELERVLGQIPRPDASESALLAWLVAAFNVLDTQALAQRCTHLAPRILELQPRLEDRRHRRRFERLRHQLTSRTDPVLDLPSPRASTIAPPVDPRIAALKTQLAGRRVLLASNRSAPEIEALLTEHLGVRAEAVATASNPRRRQALHTRILRGSYDMVLVAHGFTGHVDTEQLGAACRQAGVPFHMVDKGRFARIVDVLWTHRHPSLATIPPSAA